MKTLSYLLPPPRRDHHKLPAGLFPDVRCRSGEAARGQGCRPKFLPRIAIKGTKLSIAGGRDENQASVGNDRSTDVRRTGLGDPALLQLVELAQRGPPTNVAGVGVHRMEGTPRRLLTGVAICVGKEFVLLGTKGVRDGCPFATLHQAEEPAHVHGIHEKQASSWIEGGAAVIGTAV